MYDNNKTDKSHSKMNYVDDIIQDGFIDTGLMDIIVETCDIADIIQYIFKNIFEEYADINNRKRKKYYTENSIRAIESVNNDGLGNLHIEGIDAKKYWYECYLIHKLVEEKVDMLKRVYNTEIDFSDIEIIDPYLRLEMMFTRVSNKLADVQAKLI